jgi:hypothetical protein
VGDLVAVAPLVRRHRAANLTVTVDRSGTITAAGDAVVVAARGAAEASPDDWCVRGAYVAIFSSIQRYSATRRSLKR